jgi:hypothetical protein
MSGELPEHNCTDTEHCIGHCPGPPACTRISHQPPRDGLVWHGVGLWSAPSMTSPWIVPKRADVYMEGYGTNHREPMIGGPSR